jgi:hypothetical protein
MHLHERTHFVCSKARRVDGTADGCTDGCTDGGTDGCTSLGSASSPSLAGHAGWSSACIELICLRARPGSAEYCTALHGAARWGTAQLGSARPAKTCHRMAPHSTALHGLALHHATRLLTARTHVYAFLPLQPCAHTVVGMRRCATRPAARTER